MKGTSFKKGELSFVRKIPQLRLPVFRHWIGFGIIITFLSKQTKLNCLVKVDQKLAELSLDAVLTLLNKGETVWELWNFALIFLLKIREINIFIEIRFQVTFTI